MRSKALALSLATLMIFAFSAPQAQAVGMKEASASFLLPTTGQAMNNQLASSKTKFMAAAEVGLITTVAILGGVVGGPIIWAGLGPLIANHAWSAVDAYQGAQHKVDAPQVQQQVVQAQRTLEQSRQRRFDREEVARSSIRERIRLAGEQVK